MQKDRKDGKGENRRVIGKKKEEVLVLARPVRCGTLSKGKEIAKGPASRKDRAKKKSKSPVLAVEEGRDLDFRKKKKKNVGSRAGLTCRWMQKRNTGAPKTHSQLEDQPGFTRYQGGEDAGKRINREGRTKQHDKVIKKKEKLDD